MRVHNRPSQSSTPIFLQPTGGFIRNGHFDDASLDGPMLVVLPEMLFVLEVELVHDFPPDHLALHDPKQLDDFGGDFGGLPFPR